MAILQALALTCALNVPSGTHSVILTVHYRHLYPQDSNIIWSYTTGTYVKGPFVAEPGSVEGHPCGYTWTLDYELAKECGFNANTHVYSGDFESGDTVGWSATIGEKNE